MSRQNENVKEESTLEKRRKATSANYTMAMTALVLAFIIVVNMLVASLSTDVRQIDLTRGDIFSLTEKSIEYVEALEEDVYIYHILEDITNQNDDLARLLDVYSDTSEHIKVETINPAANPTFLENREYVSEGSIIVECGDRFKAVELSEMLIATEDSSTGNTYYFYDMEGQITSAIDYVVSEDIPQAYVINSASTDVFDETLLNGIAKQNIDVNLIDFEEKDALPEDADIVILNQPAEDITDEVYEILDKFMENGGSLMMIQYYNHNEDSKLGNIEKLLDKYGISVDYGVALETNTTYIYNDTAYYSKPLYEEHEITEELELDDVELLVVMGDAINIGEVPEGVIVDPLLTSTNRAYYKAASYKKSSSGTSMSQIASDPTGTFNYAVAVTDDRNEKQSRMVYLSSYALAETEMYKEINSSGNLQFMVRCMTWLANQDETISIDVKSRTYANIAYTVEAKNRILYTVVFIIPVAVIAYGGYVWYRRRKR